MWVSNSASSYWKSLASSADGNKLVAVIGGSMEGPIVTSTNLGISWMAGNAPVSYWFSVTASADGNKLAAVAFNGGIYRSYLTPTPHLNLTTSNTNLAVSWLIPSTNFVLQQSSDLISWSNITNPPVLNLTNLNNELYLSPKNSNGFFRLVAQ
ncbi:MAG TPA: hypothetical protein VGH42_01540 [Verrucomicrobiae bacterium]|jgi:hypothetical protein